MEKKAEKPNIELPKAKPAGKFSIVGKFLKDAGRFIFDEDESSDKVKRDLLSLEKERAEERLAAKAAQAKTEAETRAKQEAAKHRTEAAEQQAAAEANKKFLAAKQKTAEQFKREREEILKRKQLIAQQLLKEKQARHTAEHRGWFGLFKKHPLKPAVKEAPLPAASKQPAANVPAVSLPPVSQAVAGAPAPRPGSKEQAAKKFQEERLKHETSQEREQVENRAWQSYNIVATNLIREQRSMFLNWQGKILLLLLFTALSVLACVLIYGFLLVWEKDKLNSNDYVFKNLDSITQQIAHEESQAQEILNFNDKLTAVAYLLNNHIYWTNFFKFLEDNTIPEVYYESFSGDLSGKYILPAVAKDFRSVSTELKVLQANSDKVLSVSSGGAETAASQPPAGAAATSSASVNFNLDLNFDRSIFIKPPEYE
jgi:hypothetical protein